MRAPGSPRGPPPPPRRRAPACRPSSRRRSSRSRARWSGKYLARPAAAALTTWPIVRALLKLGIPTSTSASPISRRRSSTPRLERRSSARPTRAGPPGSSPRARERGRARAPGNAAARAGSMLPSGRGTRIGWSTAASSPRSFSASPRPIDAAGASSESTWRTALPLSTGPVRWWKRPPRVTRSPRRSAAWRTQASSPDSSTKGSSCSRCCASAAFRSGRPGEVGHLAGRQAGEACETRPRLPGDLEQRAREVAERNAQADEQRPPVAPERPGPRRARRNHDAAPVLEHVGGVEAEVGVERLHLRARLAAAQHQRNAAALERVDAPAAPPPSGRSSRPAGSRRGR